MTEKHGNYRFFSALLIAASTLLTAFNAGAQDFPTRPITLIVGLGAGGGTDINARLYAEVISRSLGQRVIVENRPGAGGATAAAQVERAAPDGYTLLVISGLQHAYSPVVQPGVYEPVKGFAPVSLIFDMVSMLTVPIDSPAQNTGELIELGRKKPGGLSLGAPGVGSPPHLFGALINEATGVPLQTVQYRGSTTIMADLAGARIDFAFPTYGLGQPFLADKKVRALAIASDRRWSEMPELPTLKETGVVREMVPMWFGVVAPAGTPASILQKLHQQFVAASRDPDLVKRITATGNAIRTSTPEEMHQVMVAESAKVESLVRRLNLAQH
jgi:tripartite-type tricarboxylate transporter receptor subunit TctC